MLHQAYQVYIWGGDGAPSASRTTFRSQDCFIPVLYVVCGELQAVVLLSRLYGHCQALLSQPLVACVCATVLTEGCSRCSKGYQQVLSTFAAVFGRTLVSGGASPLSDAGRGWLTTSTTTLIEDLGAFQACQCLPGGQRRLRSLRSGATASQSMARRSHKARSTRTDVDFSHGVWPQRKRTAAHAKRWSIVRCWRHRDCLDVLSIFVLAHTCRSRT